MMRVTALRLRTLRTFLRPFLAFLAFAITHLLLCSGDYPLAPALGIAPKLPPSSDSLLDIALRSGYLPSGGHPFSPPYFGFLTPLGEACLKPLLGIGSGPLLLHLPQGPAVYLPLSHRLLQLVDFLPKYLNSGGRHWGMGGSLRVRDLCLWV